MLIDHENLEFDPRSPRSGFQSLFEAEEGYIVGRIGNEFLRLKTDAHLLTVSPTGGGKGTGLIIPNLLAHPGSAVVIDIRGETVAKTALARRLQGHKVIVVDPFDLTGNKWGRDYYNPLDPLLATIDDVSADDKIERFVEMLMFDPSGRKSTEPIWDNATKDLLSGLITLCVRYWPPHKQNLLEIFNVLLLPPPEMEKFTAELTAMVENDPAARADYQLKSLIKILTDAKTTTKISDNALVQAKTALTWVGRKSFREVIEDSSFSFDELGGGKTTVYLVIPEEHIKTCAIWTRIMLESAIFSLEDVYNSKGVSTSELRQEERVLFLLDELPAFGQLDIVSSGMATLRGRGVNLWLFIQNLAQLDAIYGKEMARVIIGNAACLQVFNSTELEELEYLSRLIGEEFYDIQSVTISESETKGHTVTKGVTHTVSNSESLTKTHGTSDTLSEAVTINWSKAFGKSWNNSQSTQRGGNQSFNKGKNQGGGKGFKRNLLWSTDVTRNENEGSSETYGTGTNWSKGESQSQGENITKTQGGGETRTAGSGRQESNSITSQGGTSKAVQESQADSSSSTAGRSVTVKKERMKIETVRTVREKLSGRNQLLYVRGYHPFFCPRMSYFVKHLDIDRFMFPDMAALASLDAFDKMANRQYLAECTEAALILSEGYRILDEMKNRIASANHSRNDVQLLMDYKQFLFETTSLLLKQCDSAGQELLKQRQGFGEAVLASLAIVSVMKRLEIKEFMEFDAHLVSCMERIEVVPARRAEDFETLQKLQQLPLFKMDDQYNSGKAYSSMYISYTKDWLPAHNYDLDPSDKEWLGQVYSQTLSKAVEIMKVELDRLRNQMDNQAKLGILLKGWMKNIRLWVDVGDRRAFEAEFQQRHDFFLKRHGMMP